MPTLFGLRLPVVRLGLTPAILAITLRILLWFAPKMEALLRGEATPAAQFTAQGEAILRPRGLRPSLASPALILVSQATLPPTNPWHASKMESLPPGDQTLASQCTALQGATQMPLGLIPSLAPLERTLATQDITPAILRFCAPRVEVWALGAQILVRPWCALPRPTRMKRACAFPAPRTPSPWLVQLNSLTALVSLVIRLKTSNVNVCPHIFLFTLCSFFPSFLLLGSFERTSAINV